MSADGGSVARPPRLHGRDRHPPPLFLGVAAEAQRACLWFPQASGLQAAVHRAAARHGTLERAEQRLPTETPGVRGAWGLSWSLS